MLFIIAVKWKYPYHENITVFIATEVNFHIADLVTYSSSVSWLRAEEPLQFNVLPHCPEETESSWLVARATPPYFLFLTLEVSYSHKEVNNFFLAVVRSHRIMAGLGAASGHCLVLHPCSQQVAQDQVLGWDLSISIGWRFQGICNIFLMVLLWCINCMAILLTQKVYLGLLTCCPSVGYTARSTCEFSRFLKLKSVS